MSEAASPSAPIVGNPEAGAPPHPAAPPTRTVEEWCTIKSTPPWAFRCAQVGSKWPQGKQATEAEYDQAITAATTTPHR